MLSVLAIIVPLIVLVIMIWKKVNIAVSAIVCTGLMALMSGLNIYVLQMITWKHLWAISRITGH